MSNPQASPGAVAYLEQLASYFDDPDQAPHHHPPAPPTAEISIEVSAAVARLMAMFLDYQQTGEVHMNPSVEARLRAAEMIDKRMSQ